MLSHETIPLHIYNPWQKEKKGPTENADCQCGARVHMKHVA